MAQKWGGLAEATSATYSLPLTQINQAGSYSVVVSNPAGSITSAPPAVLTVNTLAAQGTVVAWGDNSFGQTTVPVAAQSGVTAIAAGGNHTVALKDDGMVMVWGSNEFGQTTVPVAAQSGVMAIAAGAHHTLALKNDGTMVAWGFNLLGEVTGTPTAEYPYSATASPVTLGGQVLSGVTAIAAGGYHTVALKNDGTVVAWGDNSGHVIGTPARPVTLGGQVLSGVTAIAAGYNHTVALKNDGTMVAWGDNAQGQTNVPVAGQSGVTAIAAGEVHTVALRDDGTVVAWGYNHWGQTTTPAGLRGVLAIAAGGGVYSGHDDSGHTVALKNDGTVVAWGDDGAGQTMVPAGLSGVTAIAAGGNHTVALLGTVLLLPSLTARHNGHELILSWSANAVGFTLQSTLNLTPPVTWMDSTTPPAVIGTQFTVAKSPSGSTEFYRLRKL